MSPMEHDSSGHIECDHRVKKKVNARRMFSPGWKGRKGDEIAVPWDVMKKAKGEMVASVWHMEKKRQEENVSRSEIVSEFSLDCLFFTYVREEWNIAFQALFCFFCLITTRASVFKVKRHSKIRLFCSLFVLLLPFFLLERWK